jgi:NAD(P)-dependent dehydrogenase (short-subunit alcohol dehydrogenase family)
MSSMGRTKLALILFTLELSRRLDGSHVSVNALHPGVVRTGLLDAVPKPLTLLFKLIGNSPEQGARTAIYLATASEIDKVSGKLFANQKVVDIGGQAAEPGLRERLWKVSSELTGVAAAAN